MERNGGEVSCRTPSSPRAQQHTGREDQAAMRARAFELRVAGHSQQSIADQLGRDRSTISRWLQVEIDNLIVPRVEELRKVETGRLDRYLLALEPGIERGDPKSISVALRVSERRSRLLGLDAPIQIETTRITESMIDAEMRRLAGELARYGVPVSAEVLDVIGEQPPLAITATDADAVPWGDPWEGQAP